jgi:flagellar motor protein MotB
MYDRSKGSLGFNIWTVFADLAFGFMIIILLLFMMNVAELKKQQKKLKELASYAEAAMKDRAEIEKDLKKANLLLDDNSGSDKGKTILTDKIVWPVNSQYKIDDLIDGAPELIVNFGKVLKGFLDKPDSKKSEKYRHQTYTIIIIGHTNTDGDDRPNYKLSLDRANAIRDHLFEQVFNGEGDDNKYKILAAGYGEKHLIKRLDAVKGDRCIEIAFKYDEMDMIRSEN